MKTICVGAIGGTIAMKNSSDGSIVPTLNAQDLIDAIPQALQIAHLKVETLLNIASGHIKFFDLIYLYQWAKSEVKKGANGIVITQGTDTLEESAFFLSLLWDERVPLIFTGAMRGAQALGSDGLANLYSSILLATNSLSQGVMVVMNHTIHHPFFIQKKHSLALETFDSMHQEWGVIFEDRVEFFKPYFKLPTFSNLEKVTKKVLCYEHHLDDDENLLQWAGGHYDGIVIAGYGSGHTNLETLEIITKIAKKIPVIVCARTYYGPSAMQTYGYAGGEVDLQKRGIVMGGWLQPKKARILLSVLLSCNLGIKEFINFREAITLK